MCCFVSIQARFVEISLDEYAREMSLDDMVSRISKFAIERDWDQFHSVRNLILALVGEVGELAEIMQWVPDEKTDEFFDDAKNRLRFEEELADVLIYLLRLASIRNIDLEGALSRKLKNNEEKYPVAKSRGSAKKYTEL